MATLYVARNRKPRRVILMNFYIRFIVHTLYSLYLSLIHILFLSHAHSHTLSLYIYIYTYIYTYIYIYIYMCGAFLSQYIYKSLTRSEKGVVVNSPKIARPTVIITSAIIITLMT